jgi:protein O-mannosyl-transferase
MLPAAANLPEDENRMDRPKRNAWKYLLLTAICFIGYGNTIPNDYAYDDSVVITENKFTQRGIEGIPDIFKHDTFAGSYEDVPTLRRYRPLSLATFAVEHQLFGRNPHVSHFGNVLLFALTVLVLYALLRQVFGPRSEANGLLELPFVAALLFVIHPVHTEVVANIKGRDEILALASSLSATLCGLKYLSHGKLRHLALSFLFFLVALLSKESAIVFLAVVPLTVFYCKPVTWTTSLRVLSPLLLATVVFLGVRRLVLGGLSQPLPEDIITDPFTYASGAERAATILYTLGGYLRLLFFPYPLTIDYYPYHIKLMNWGNATVWLSLLAYVGLAVYALWNLRKRSVVAYGILFYLTTLFVVSNVPISLGTFMSERFVFAPSVGFVVVVAWVLSNARIPAARHRKLILLALSLAAITRVWGRNAVWKDDFTLFTTDVKTSSNSIKANLAASAMFLTESAKTGDGSWGADCRANALKHAKRAVAIYRQNVDPARRKGSSYAGAMMLLGSCYGENGLLADALGAYQDALGGAPDRDTLVRMVEAAINKSDDVDFKIRSYAEFVRLLPDSFSFNYHLGLLYGKEKNDLAMAVLYFKRAVAIASDDVNALRGLAHAQTLLGDYDSAARCFEKLVAQEPGNLAFLRSLRELYQRAGNPSGESEVARKMKEREATGD